MPYLAISQADINAHPESKKGHSLAHMLHLLGMDVNKGFEEDGRHLMNVDPKNEDTQFDFTHRSTYTNEVVKCPRYVGQTRQDGKWKRFFIDFFDLDYA